MENEHVAGVDELDRVAMTLTATRDAFMPSVKSEQSLMG